MVALYLFQVDIDIGRSTGKELKSVKCTEFWNHGNSDGRIHYAPWSQLGAATPRMWGPAVGKWGSSFPSPSQGERRLPGLARLLHPGTSAHLSASSCTPSSRLWGSPVPGRDRCPLGLQSPGGLPHFLFVHPFHWVFQSSQCGFLRWMTGDPFRKSHDKTLNNRAFWEQGHLGLGKIVIFFFFNKDRGLWDKCPLCNAV